MTPRIDSTAASPESTAPVRASGVPWSFGSTLAPYRTSESALRLIVGAFVLLPILWTLENLLPPLNFDVAAILHFSDQWLSGQRLYVDLIDVNPPLIFLLETAPVLLSRVFGLDAPTWMAILTLGIAAMSSILFLRLQAIRATADQTVKRVLVPLALLFALLVLPFEGFAQREHLLVIMTMPYLQLTAARIERTDVPRALVYAVAIFAAVGFAIKPHFLPAALLIELYVLASVGLRKALRDPTPWAMAATWVAYLAFALAVTPEYFTEALPLIFGFYTRIGDTSAFSLLLGRPLGPLVLGTAALGLIALVVAPSAMLRTLVLFSFGAAIATMAQAKGWLHHYYPLKAALFVGVAFAVSAVLDRYLPADRAQRRAPIAIFTILLMGAAYIGAAISQPPLQRYRDFENSDTWHLMSLVKRYAGRKPILILSPGIDPHYPMMNYADVRMAMDFQTMWALQGAYAECDMDAPLYREPKDMSDLERKVFDGVPEDFVANKPALVILDTIPGIPQCRAETFSYLDYFMRNPAFAGEWRNYIKLAEYKRYVVYRRR